MTRILHRAARNTALVMTFGLVGVVRGNAQATNTLPADVAAKVQAAIADVMKRTNVPSASVGIVQNGQIAFIGAFGRARLNPDVMASPDMHYAIGSISKQFTTACIMLLAQDGKLTLDDPVAKYFPELTRAKEVTIRNLLSHTSGYEDYAPQDYTIPAWTKATTAQAVVHEWATKPLDFEPGTQYQYSNTNFNIVGLIVEKVSGQPFWTFLSTHVLNPLGLTKTIDMDTQRSQLEPIGYFRNALGPLRPALMEAPGWYFADGEMAMPPGDLLKWDIAMMNQSLLKPASWAAMESEMMLKNGRGAGYGLGVSVGMRDGHRIVSHGGEVGGFVASNTVLPDDKIAIVVLTNQEASSARGRDRARAPHYPAAAGARQGSGCGQRRSPGARDTDRPAAGHHRPDAVHGERQFLLRQDCTRRFCLVARTPRRNQDAAPDQHITPRRNDVPRLPGGVCRRHQGLDYDIHHARRQAGAVPGRRGGMTFDL